MADRFGSSKEKSYRSRNRAIAALVQSTTNIVTTDIDGLDSAATIALINSTSTGLDSAQVLSIAGDAGLDSAAVLSVALSGYGERKTFIQSSAPTSDFQVGDFWWDRDGNTLYKGSASSSYSSYPLPAGTMSQYPGLALDARGNHLTKSPGYTSANFTLSGAGTQSYPNTGVFATHGGTYPWEPFDASNTGVKYTLTTPTTFYAFSTPNTDAGWIYKIEYEDGSYAISNNASPIVEPTSLSWFDAGGNSLSKTVSFGNGLRILTHPSGVKCSAFVVARGSYGTRNYDFWIFFSGADYWAEVGDMYIDSDTVRSYVTADHINSLGISAGLDSAAVTSLIDSSYINARIGDGTVEAIVDSAYIQLRDRFQDSAGVTAIIDSAYIQARQSNVGGGGVDSAATISLINSVIDSASRQFTYTYTASAGQTLFSGSDDNGASLAYSTGNILTFLNGILLVDSADYTATTGNSIVINSAASLNDILNVTKFTSATSGSALSHTQYKYTINTPATTFTGADDNSNTLSYDAGELQVHLNGILLVDSDDYTASNGTSVVLTQATDSNDVVLISVYTGGAGGGSSSSSGGTDSATVISLSGELKGGMFRINPQILSQNVTIDSAENAHCAGPISFDSGVVLTINGNLVIS
jgi:hypothetical protein